MERELYKAWCRDPKPSPTIGLTVACLRNPKADKAIKNPAIENVDETT